MAPEVSVHSASVNFKTIITENVLMRVETPVFCHGTRPRFLDEKSKQNGVKNSVMKYLIKLLQ